jgi:DNA (cytosine-5)-methyltransferase 1
MENVPALAETGVFRKFVEKLKDLNYHYDFKIIKCNEYGLSQLRQRVILVASQLGPIQVPPPPKNVHVQTVREIIGNLPPLEAGECDPNDRLHFCAALSPLNMKRIKASKQGGTWRDWPEDLVAACHRKDTGKTYGGVYGRMSWDKPAPTMTTQFYGFGNGRFGHPEQNRAISIREGAMFQGFPRDYQFVPEGEHSNISLLGKMIGNAVPVQLGKLIGETFMAHLRQLDL